MARLNIKPLSVNEAWQGKRYKTPKYHAFQKEVLSSLKPMQLPLPPYEINITFGFSNAASDWDNPIKLFVDCLAKKYGFNDKLIRRGIVNVEKANKGSEFIDFEIKTLVK